MVAGCISRGLAEPAALRRARGRCNPPPTRVHSRPGGAIEAAKRGAGGKTKTARQTDPAGREGVGTALWLALFVVLFVVVLVRNFFLAASEIGTVRIGPLTLAPFGPLVSLGVLFGIHLMRSWCARFDLEWERVFTAVGWMLVIGFVGSHLLDVALYNPEDFFDPSVVLDFRSDYSSFGGVVCGGLAAYFAFRRGGVPLLRGMECTLYGFVGGWLFGRLACFSVHDHPGIETSSPLGVMIDGTRRHDLGFYELLYTIVLFAVLFSTTRERRPDGYVIALVATSYAPIRFALDFLRVRDATYGGLTPAQWACIPLLAIGLYFLRRTRSAASPGANSSITA